MPKPNKYDRAHLRNLRRYQKQIDAIYAAAIQEAAAIGGLVQNLDPDKIFSFADYPITHDRVRKLLARLASEMEMCIVNGVRSEWMLANNKNNALCDRVFGENKLSLPYEAQRRYYATNDAALEAFLGRQTDGLNLSDRVWRYTDAFKQEIELGLDLGIRSGQDARAMAKDLKTFLRFPDKLFRRVRDEHGDLQLSKAAAAFHPGRGVYRSSYKNALRLAATETNIAYRTADHERWGQLDFVVGQEVRCSDTNHPVADICDTLAGKYPKDFKFVGWHPFCRCYVIPVLKTEPEVDADCQRILRGEEPLPSEDSENVVANVPDGFDKWVADNAARTATSRAVPYFMLDNPSFVADAFSKAVTGRTSFAIDMMKQMPYLEDMTRRDPRIAAIWAQLDGGAMSMSDIEKAMLLGKARGICGQLTYVDLEKRGLIGEDWVMRGVDRNFVVQPKANYRVSDTGELVSLSQVRMDMVVVRDASGRQFAYPVGVKDTEQLFSAKTASEVISEFPPVLQAGIKRISFYPQECPADPYWRKEYHNPKHRSWATDGGMTSVWKCGQTSPRELFREKIAHEAGHALDGPLRAISNSEEWREAVQADLDMYREKHYPIMHNGAVSRYGMNNACEDFAESMRMFIDARAIFKGTFPHREVFISRLLHGGR